MTIRKVGEDEELRKWLRPVCAHPEHDLPKMVVLDPGIYEHTCPGCGAVTYFEVKGRLPPCGRCEEMRSFPPYRWSR